VKLSIRLRDYCLFWIYCFCCFSLF